MPSDSTARSGGLPADFFSASTFGTLSGCAVVTWVVTAVLSGVLRGDPKIVGLVVAIAIAYVGLFLSGQRGKEHYVVSFFNGFLIYLTVVGSTSFLPYVNPKTAGVVGDKPREIARPWVPDRNLVAATKNLVAIKETQTRTLADVHRKLETTHTIPAAERAELLNTLKRNEVSVGVRTTSLRRLGIPVHD